MNKPICNFFLTFLFSVPEMGAHCPRKVKKLKPPLGLHNQDANMASLFCRQKGVRHIVRGHLVRVARDFFNPSLEVPVQDLIEKLRVEAVVEHSVHVQHVVEDRAP